MKRFWGLLLLVCLATPAWSAKKSSVQELKDLLISMQQAKKSDFEVATRLKEVELREELTPAMLEDLMQYAPGSLSDAQLQIIEGRNAVLAPPSSDLPATPTPDVAAQKTIIAKAVDYVTKTYMQNPHLSATRTTSRFQDGVTSIRTNSGVTNNMPNSDRVWATPNKFMELLGTHTEPVESDKGIEKVAIAKDKTPWGQNGQVSEGGPGPILSVILQEAADGGKLNWLRWEMVNGKQMAVFSFAVPKKKSHYEVNYCCFPVTEDAGRMGYEGTGPNFQTGTSWKGFKTTVPYHGEFFVEPESGTIVRVVTQAELKPTDFVHQEDMRIDYGPIFIGDKTYIVPLDSFTFTEVVPNGDNYAAVYSVRHTLFNSTYQNYALASETNTAQK
jgi:hypothetical protein